jgi:hypothetical protein
MTTTNTAASSTFPLPHRAPGFRRASQRPPQPREERSPSDRIGRRAQRAFDGWLAGRIRKQSRHWRGNA